MWSKIKKLPIPISIKLSILYSSILFFILLITSALILTSLYYNLHKDAKNEVMTSANNIIQYLTPEKPIAEQVLSNDLLSTDVTLHVYNSLDEKIYDSNPDLFTRHDKNKNYRNIERSFKDNKELSDKGLGKNFYIYSITWTGNQTYTLKFIKPMFEQLNFLEFLTKSLLFTILIGLVIAVVSGIFISRKILRPIIDITSTAIEIEVTDLSKRIQLGEVRDELYDLGNTFNHMLEKIQNGFEKQRRFVSDASHELRTPITIIDGYVNMLDRWGKQNSSVLDEGIEAIKTEASNMNLLIEKLLLLARADQGEQIINKGPIEMVPFIQEIYQETCLIAPNHKIHLVQNDPVTIIGDVFFLKQMLRIFLDNSIKYTQPGGIISITSQKCDSNLKVSIQDNGVGIKESEHDKIFDRFYRVDKSRSKETGGTGLGLSIARWISEQHNSTIQIDSSPGKGTTITVVFQ